MSVEQQSKRIRNTILIQSRAMTAATRSANSPDCPAARISAPQNASLNPMHLGDMLRQTASRNPQKPALICGEQVVSFEAFDQSTDALAGWFLREGLKAGDRIAIHWTNSIEVANLYFACFKAGMIAVPVNNRLKPAEIAYVLQHSGARLCFSQPELAHLSEEARAGSADLQAIHTALPVLSGIDEPLPAVIGFETAAILYTSGTTAQPKGVMHTHLSLIASASLTASIGLNESDTLIAVTQMLHASGLNCCLLPGIAEGATVVLLPLFDAGRALDLIERWRCSYFLAMPAFLQFIVEEQSRNPRDISSMRTCLAGGDAVPVALQERFRSLFGFSVLEGFGMTETVPACAIRKGESRPGSMGRQMNGVEIRLVNQAGRILGHNEIGEMQVRSPANCVGYWNNPDATAEAFEDGWLRTGDLVRRDRDGFLWFEGRVKQIIVRGGSNISPQEVEEALYQHPAVLEAGVIGMPDAVHGEKVIAFIALREGFSADEEELRGAVSRLIADHKVPERVFFLQSLPKGLTGKVQRRALKDLLMASSEHEMAAGA